MSHGPPATRRGSQRAARAVFESPERPGALAQLPEKLGRLAGKHEPVHLPGTMAPTSAVRLLASGGRGHPPASDDFLDAPGLHLYMLSSTTGAPVFFLGFFLLQWPPDSSESFATLGIALFLVTRRCSDALNDFNDFLEWSNYSNDHG